MNATDFFERREGVHCLPACSESFWSTVSPVLYNQTKDLRRELGARFGILLWKDVFRAMYRYNFSLPGLSIQTLPAYTNATHDCHSW